MTTRVRSGSALDALESNFEVSLDKDLGNIQATRAGNSRAPADNATNAVDEMSPAVRSPYKPAAPPTSVPRTKPVDSNKQASQKKKEK